MTIEGFPLSELKQFMQEHIREEDNTISDFVFRDPIVNT